MLLINIAANTNLANEASNIIPKLDFLFTCFNLDQQEINTLIFPHSHFHFKLGPQDRKKSLKSISCLGQDADAIFIALYAHQYISKIFPQLMVQ